MPQIPASGFVSLYFVGTVTAQDFFSTPSSCVLTLSPEKWMEETVIVPKATCFCSLFLGWGQIYSVVLDEGKAYNKWGGKSSSERRIICSSAYMT